MPNRFPGGWDVCICPVLEYFNAAYYDIRSISQPLQSIRNFESLDIIEVTDGQVLREGVSVT